MSAPKVCTGACHCGAVRFTVTLVDGLDNPRRCNCSLCRMRGAVVVIAAALLLCHFHPAAGLTAW